MRKFVILGLAFFLVIISGVRGQDTNNLSDQVIQHKLTGKWVATWGKGLTTTNIIAADGSYVSQVSGITNGPMAQYKGTFVVKDGIVVGKAIFGNQTVKMHLHIIQLDSHELVWSNEGAPAASTFHKVGG